MLFHRLDFLMWFALVWCIYAILGRKAQNGLLLVASLLFYAAWDWRFVGLLLVSVIADFAAGLLIADKPQWKKLALGLSLTVNLGVLGFFKYFNFFTDSLIALMHSLGISGDFPTLHVILPIGISFYTFQSVGYTIDVYRGGKPCRHLPTFALFVTYFPQLISGPIEQARRLIPQFEKARTLSWTMFCDGAWLIVLGIFKKVAIADLMAPQVDAVFAHLATASMLKIVIATVGFMIQLYADFSGYSDMAVGLSLLLGIKLSRNFSQALFFPRSVTDFWLRWHITLTAWFREYVYGPLRGSSSSNLRGQFATVVTMVIVGLWHDAKWTFVAWGFLNGMMLIAERGLGIDGFGLVRKDQKVSRWVSASKDLLRRLLALAAISTVSLLFRLESFQDLPAQWPPLGSLAELPNLEGLTPFLHILFLLVFVDGVAEIKKRPVFVREYRPAARVFLYLYVFAAVIGAGGYPDQPYAYFQF